jgi:hypothetical protein
MGKKKLIDLKEEINFKNLEIIMIWFLTIYKNLIIQISFLMHTLIIKIKTR